MIVTEEQAKTKWCPFSRDSGSAAIEPSFNRVNGESGPGSTCFGSACMAWRERTPEYPSVNVDGECVEAWELDGYAKVGQIGPNTWRMEKPAAAMAGFCGLAGKP